MLLAISAGPACSHSSPPASRPNILVILADTLRHDRLGSYESKRGLTPFLDSLAQHAYVFERAYAQSSWTNPSVASLLTSRYQSQHHIISFGSVLSADERTLPEILKQDGYATGAFCANILVNSKLGFDQGFDEFKNIWRPGNPDSFPRMLKGRAEELNRQALQWLDSVRSDDKQSHPFFLYLQYMEPHAPYDPPEEFVTRVLNGRARPDLKDVNEHMSLVVLEFTDELVRAAQDFYDAEVMSMDAQLKDLFTNLQSRGLLDNTIIVFVADHGEEFKEHGLVGHNQTLYEEVIRVPLFLIMPGQRQHREIADVVELVDIAPTLLELAGLPPSDTFMGRSLAPLLGLEHADWWSRLRHMSRSESGPHPAFSELIKTEDTLRESPHERAVVLGHDKLIVGVDGEREYYDLAADPGEKNPQANVRRSTLYRAVEQLYAYGAAKGTPKKGTLDAETRERMRALGYQE